MAIHIGRREFLATLGGAAVAWPLAVGAQQASRVLRVGFVGMQPRDGNLRRLPKANGRAGLSGG